MSITLLLLAFFSAARMAAVRTAAQYGSHTGEDSVDRAPFSVLGNPSERLVVESAGPGHLLVQLTFEASTPPSNCKPARAQFPGFLERLVLEHRVRALQLTLSRGRQAMLAFSATLEPHAPPPAGLALRVQFEEGVEDTRVAVRALAQSLGGVLGVPLARVAEEGLVAAPLVGWLGDRAVARAQLYVGFPKEACCIGQLAAWANLLPCNGSAGLAALLQRAALAAAPYMALELRLRREVGSGTGGCHCHAAVGQQSSAAGSAICIESRVALLLQSNSEGGSTLEPRSRYPGCPGCHDEEPAPAGSSANDVAALVWRLFQRPLPDPCTGAASAVIYLQSGLLHHPKAGTAEGGTGHAAGLACGSLGEGAARWLACSLLRPNCHKAAAPDASLAAVAGPVLGAAATAGNSWVRVARQVVLGGLAGGELVLSIQVAAAAYLSGSSGSSGNDSSGRAQAGSLGGVRMETEASEAAASLPPPAALLHIWQPVPWQLPVKLHTLRLRVNGQVVRPPHPLVAWQRLLPTGGPSVPGVLELLLQLPGPEGGAGGRAAAQHSFITLSVGISKQLLSVFQQPPDASRGVEIAAAEVTLVPAACAELPLYASDGQAACRVRRAYSTAQLVPLPLPDLSMPFNVCCFTGSLVAVYLGGALNALLRPLESQTAGGLAVRGGGRRAQLRRALLLGLLGASLALYLDHDLQRRTDILLQSIALGTAVRPPAQL